MRLPRCELEHPISNRAGGDDDITNAKPERVLVIDLGVGNLEWIGHDLSPNELKTKHTCSLIHVSNIRLIYFDIGYYLFM